MMTLTKEHLISVLSQEGSFLANDDLRTNALDFINSNNLPTTKVEEWRHIKLSPALDHTYALSSTKEATSEHYALDMDGYKITLVNGRFAPELSDTNSAEFVVMDLAEAAQQKNEIFEAYFGKTNLQNNHIFAALNTAFASNGCLIYVPKDASVSKPLQIVHITSGSEAEILSAPRHLVVADQFSKIQITENYHNTCEAVTLTNVATEVFVNEGAKVDYHIFQGEGNKAAQINNLHVVQSKFSTFNSSTFSLCGALIRNDIKVELKEEGAECNINGFSLADKKQQFDNHVDVLHFAPQCNSQQIYRGIADDESSVVFMGKVTVAQDAQQTNAAQSNKNILLSEKASINSKPQLEIYADDVACSHGSTTGQLDKEALFYMRARGLDEDQASILLLRAFAADVIEQVSIEPLRHLVESLIEQRLTGKKEKNACTDFLN